MNNAVVPGSGLVSPFAMPARRDPEAEARAIVRDLPPLVTAKKAAALLNISVRTLERWCGSGRIAVIKTSAAKSSRVLVSRDELQRFLATLIHNPRAERGHRGAG